MRLLAFLLGLSLLLATGAFGYVRSGPGVMPHGHHRLLTPGGAPLDALQAPSEAYGFRLLRTAYAGPSARLRRASDNLELDIGFVGPDFALAAASAHCNATTCFVVTWYDQSGNGRHVTQATAANQPAYVGACKGALPCMQTTGAVQRLVTAGTYASATGVMSFSAVANRAVGTAAYCQFVMPYGATPNYFATNAVATNWFVYAGSGGQVNNATATDAAWHVANAVMNGAASVFRIEANEATGTVAVNTNSGTLAVSTGSAATTCNYAEAAHWDNYVMTPAERATLSANQRAYWGI